MCMHILIQCVNIIHAFQLEATIDTDWLKLLARWKVTWLISRRLIACAQCGDVDRQPSAITRECIINTMCTSCINKTVFVVWSVREAAGETQIKVHMHRVIRGSKAHRLKVMSSHTDLLVLMHFLLCHRQKRGHERLWFSRSHLQKQKKWKRYRKPIVLVVIQQPDPPANQRKAHRSSHLPLMSIKVCCIERHGSFCNQMPPTESYVCGL